MPVMPGSGVAGSGVPVSGAAVSGAAVSGASGPVPPSVPPVTPSVPPVPPSVVPEPRDAVPQDATPASGDRLPGKLSLSVAAASTPGEDGRGRRMSCTVALAVAGALAAVTVGSAFVFELLPDGDRDTNTGSGSASSQAPGKDASTAPVEGSVPARYLGTWEGKGIALDGVVPLGDFRLTVQQAAVGEELGRLRQTDQIGGVCVDVLTLKKVTKKQLVATSVGAETNHVGCNPAATTVTLTPVGDDLKYESDSEKSGRPEGRLSKVG